MCPPPPLFQIEERKATQADLIARMEEMGIELDQGQVSGRPWRARGARRRPSRSSLLPQFVSNEGGEVLTAEEVSEIRSAMDSVVAAVTEPEAQPQVGLPPPPPLAHPYHATTTCSLYWSCRRPSRWRVRPVLPPLPRRWPART